MNTVATRTGLVAYEEQGTGSPLLLLHANASAHFHFDDIVPELALSYRTIAVDWPGCGESAAPNPPQTATAMMMADVLEDVVAGLNLEPAILLGHSVEATRQRAWRSGIPSTCAHSSWSIRAASRRYRASSVGCSVRNGFLA